MGQARVANRYRQRSRIRAAMSSAMEGARSVAGKLLSSARGHVRDSNRPASCGGMKRVREP